jgi:hypothetical protein
MTRPEPRVGLRPFPFPYRAGLALCSDIDDCDVRTFTALHRFLNDPVNGLGLPVSDSFFPQGRTPGQMALFGPDGRTPGPDAGLIVEAIRSGLIDSIHSWGDYNAAPPEPETLRRLALATTEHLLGRGLNLRVWINHGAPSNHQNLRARTFSMYRGDDPGSPLYTADLVRSLGVRFYWPSELTPWPLSTHRGRASLRFLGRVWGNRVKNLVKRSTGRGSLARSTAMITELCSPVHLSDGEGLLAFSRFNRHPNGLWAQPTRHTLRHALSRGVLAHLLAEQGYLVLYTHLGQPSPASGDLFPGPDREALERLAGLYRSGEIWVAPTGRLLQFWLASRALRWSAEQGEHAVTITIHGLEDPVHGQRMPAPDELAGISFTTPRPGATRVLMGGREQATLTHPADRSGVAAVSFALPEPPALDCLGRGRLR